MGAEEQQRGEHEARITILETNQRIAREELREDLSKIYGILDVIREHQAKSTANPCPEPGSCIPLRETVKTVGDRVTNLEAWRNLIVGGGIVAWVFILGAIYVAYDYLKSKMAGG